MADGGLLRAFFRTAAQDTAQAVEDTAAKMAGFGEATARNIRDSVTAVRNADSASTEAVNAIRPSAAGDPAAAAEDKAPAGDAGGRSAIARMLDPEDGAVAGAMPSLLKSRQAGGALDSDLRKVNPRFDPDHPAYSENCTSVVQAYELRRRGLDVRAGPLPRNRWSSEGGPGGYPTTVITQAWGGTFTEATKAVIEAAFAEPGSRGIIGIVQDSGNRHVFSVENVRGQVHFVDAQFRPPVTDASHYFDMGHSTAYLRLDNLPTPPAHATMHYLEP